MQPFLRRDKLRRIQLGSGSYRVDMELQAWLLLLGLCVGSALATCSDSGYYHCGGGNNDTCVHFTKACDNTKHCPDGWDEQGCSSSCSAGSFSCDRGRCFHLGYRCDGGIHCHNEWDENACDGCRNGAFHCDKTRCVNSNMRCNGVKDCRDGTDEDNCTSCNGNTVLCDGARCVTAAHKCDRVQWCRDAADEAACTAFKSPVCPMESRCNSVQDACSWDDELGCSPDMCRPPSTPRTFCDGRCVNASRWCDGVRDCSDGIDETGCRQCNSGARLCDGRCIEQKYVCDGLDNCKDGGDEGNCTACQPTALMCDGNRCVHKSHLCDNVTWCNDGTDENGCQEYEKVPNCPMESRCNSVPMECWTGDDEKACDPEMCRQPSQNLTFCDGRCLATSSWCDGVPDCADGQDESSCNITSIATTEPPTDMLPRVVSFNTVVSVAGLVGAVAFCGWYLKRRFLGATYTPAEHDAELESTRM